MLLTSDFKGRVHRLPQGSTAFAKRDLARPRCMSAPSRYPGLHSRPASGPKMTLAEHMARRQQAPYNSGRPPSLNEYAKRVQEMVHAREVYEARPKGAQQHCTD